MCYNHINMRIKFLPISPVNSSQIKYDILNFNVVNRLYSYRSHFIDEMKVSTIESYSDNSRYILNICKASITFEEKGKKITSYFSFIEMQTLFNLPFNFDLFRDDFVNYWQKDFDIGIIKPLILSSGSESNNLGILGFRSLATSFFAKIPEILNNSGDIVIKKNGDKIIFAFPIDKYSLSKMDILIETFINAIYELIKNTSSRQLYYLPEINYSIKVNLGDQYKKERKRNRFKKKSYQFQKI